MTRLYNNNTNIKKKKKEETKDPEEEGSCIGFRSLSYLEFTSSAAISVPEKEKKKGNTGVGLRGTTEKL